MPGGRLEVPANQHPDPECGFDVGPLPEGTEAVIHTHPAGCAWPSFRDQAQQIATGVPWIIAPWRQVPFVIGGASEPLLRRPFRWGATDCWGAVRDALRELYGARVGNYPREWQFWRTATATFEPCLIPEGWSIVSADVADAIEGDVLLQRLHSKVYNHCALVLPSGEIYHHPSTGRPYDPTALPRVEALERYQRIPTAVVRHV